jgi:AcrR family transcriptional regulator
VLIVSKRPPSRTFRPGAKRQQLLDAAAWAFARKGYRATGVADVIARAGVARGTFYLYFDSKEEIFLAIVDAFADRIKRMLDETDAPVRLAEHHGQAMLQRTFRRWLELFAAHRDAAAVVLKEAAAIDPRLAASAARLRALALTHFADRARRAQAHGLMSPEVSPQLVAHLQIAMIEEVAAAFILDDAAVDVDDLARQVAAFEWHGIRPDRRY